LLLGQPDLEIDVTTRRDTARPGTSIHVKATGVIHHVAGVADLDHGVSPSSIYYLWEDQDGPWALRDDIGASGCRNEHAPDE
jgi:hypothetical protein